MTIITASTSADKPEAASTAISTGSCPVEWREWWRDESVRLGTDWKTILGGAETALRRLYARHGSRSHELG